MSDKVARPNSQHWTVSCTHYPNPSISDESTRLADGWTLIFTMYSSQRQHASLGRLEHGCRLPSWLKGRMASSEPLGRGFETRLPRLCLFFSLFKVSIFASDMPENIFSKTSRWAIRFARCNYVMRPGSTIHEYHTDIPYRGTLPEAEKKHFTEKS